MSETTKSDKENEKSGKRERLAAELRANLRKRKAKAQAQKQNNKIFSSTDGETKQ